MVLLQLVNVTYRMTRTQQFAMEYPQTAKLCPGMSVTFKVIMALTRRA